MLSKMQVVRNMYGVISMTKCSRCGVDNEENPKVILAKHNDRWYCGHCLSVILKRDVRSVKYENKR